jgi:hypothetical protein
VSVTGRRTRLDWARENKATIDGRYPDADQIVLMMDKLRS